MPHIVAKLPVSEGWERPQHASEIGTPIEQPQKKSRLLQYWAAPTAAPVITKTPTQEIFEYLHDSRPRSVWSPNVPG